MRKVQLEITLTMVVDSIESIVAIGGPKQVIDTYISNQPAGSKSNGSFDQKGDRLFYTVILNVVVSDRADANAKMNQIESNLELLPRVWSLTYRYEEREKHLNNVPEIPE